MAMANAVNKLLKYIQISCSLMFDAEDINYVCKLILCDKNI